MEPIMKVDIDPSTRFPYLLPRDGTWTSNLNYIDGLLAGFDVGLVRVLLAIFHKSVSG
jgi:hypothetical protein